jgi:hypothetical protein
LLQEIRVIYISDENMPGLFLLLEMTFQAKRCVAFVEEPLVDGAVGRMADHTALTHRLMLVNPGAALRGVTLEAGFVSAQESKAAAFECLLHIGPAALNRHPDMRIMAISTTHFPFQDRMTMWKLKTRPYFEVTLKTCLR